MTTEAAMPHKSLRAREKLLDQAARQSGARLVVVIFRFYRNAEEWLQLVSEVTQGLEGTGIPVLDLGPALLANHHSKEFWGHAHDGHPNDIAHRIAAEASIAALADLGWLPPVAGS